MAVCTSHLSNRTDRLIELREFIELIERPLLPQDRRVPCARQVLASEVCE